MSNNLIEYYKYRSEQRKFLQRSRSKLLPNSKKSVMSVAEFLIWMTELIVMVTILSAIIVDILVLQYNWIVLVGFFAFGLGCLMMLYTFTLLRD